MNKFMNHDWVVGWTFVWVCYAW